MTLDTYWNVYAAICLGIPVSILCLLVVELRRDFTRRGRSSWIAADWKPVHPTDRRNPTE